MARPNGQWSLSDFQLTKQLYKGKASTLYLAVDRHSGATVALKSYSKRRLSPLNWHQVEREVRLHAQLRHPGIITLHAAFEDDNYVFMVTEYAEGGDLYEDLKRAGGQMRERMVAREVLPPFLAALAFMHANSIVHRDIKPENILLTADRSIKVADFGLSINWAEERPVTRAGTLDYMSPEVLHCPEKSKPEENKERVELGYSDAVDVWAVGVLAFELLVGRPPFERESREETYQSIQHKEPALPAWLSDPAREFITAALAKSARKRPTVAQLLLHPWIQLHVHRPSISAPSPASSDLHMQLQGLAGPRGPPFSQLHRQSLHGAKSVRDFSALLSPAPSGSPHMLTALLQPSLSMAGPSLAAAAATALDAPASGSGSVSSSNSTVLPTTASSKLGSGAGHWSAVPLAGPALQALSAGLPAPAFPQAEADDSMVDERGAGSDRQADVVHSAEPASASSSYAAPPSNHGRDPPSAGHSSQISLQGPSAAGKLLSSPFDLQQATLAPVAPAAEEPRSAFLELYKSLAPLPTDKAGDTAPSPRGPPSKGSQAVPSRAAAKGGSLAKGPEAGQPALHPQQHQKAAASPAASAQDKLPSLQKASLQPVVVCAEATASSAQAVPAASIAAAAARLAAAAPTASEGAAPQPAPEAAKPHRETEQPAPVLAAIAEHCSSESAEAVDPSSLSTLDAGQPDHQATASMAGMATAKAAAAVEQPASGKSGEGRIAAQHATIQLPSTTQQPSQVGEQSQAREAAGEAEQASSPRQAVDASALDRMREAEQRHFSKLRGRSASVAVRASCQAATTLMDGGPGPQLQRSASTGRPGYGSSLAKSASHLLSKLLGKKDKAGSSGKPASAGQSLVHSLSSPSTSASRSGIPHRGSAAVLQRSASMVSIAAASVSSAGGAPASGSPGPSMASQRPGLMSPAAHTVAQAPQTSPRSRPSQVHTSNGVRMQRHSLAAAKPAASATIMLRSPVGAGSSHPSTGKAAPAASDASLPGSVAQHDSAVTESDAPATGTATTQVSDVSAAVSGGSVQGGKAEAQAVQPSSSSKTVRFAWPLAGAGPGAEPQDLIPAVHHTESSSYTSANSSLLGSSLPSLTASGTGSPLRAGRKGSASPPVSRKASHLTPTPTRTSLLRAAGAASGRLRANKMASMPGDGGKGLAPRGGRVGAGGGNTGDAVQRSAASWSHSQHAQRSTAKLSPAAEARLRMYRALQ
ncbi:hypothetical protein ABPG77_006794 [Micractinium sp. CCAP 211/92]